MTAINKLNLSEIENFAEFPQMDKYQNVASGSAIYPGRGTFLGLNYCALKLNGEAGELAEHVGKAMRDDGLISAIGFGPGFEFGDLTPERRELIIKEVGDCLWYLSAISRELEMNLSEIAAINLRKLYDRQERNALQGSGDNR